MRPFLPAIGARDARCGVDRERRRQRVPDYGLIHGAYGCRGSAFWLGGRDSITVWLTAPC
jgi:hypothetical protein